MIEQLKAVALQSFDGFLQQFTNIVLAYVGNHVDKKMETVNDEIRKLREEIRELNDGFNDQIEEEVREGVRDMLRDALKDAASSL